MKSAALEMMKATYGKIDPHRRINSFEVIFIFIKALWIRFYDR